MRSYQRCAVCSRFDGLQFGIDARCGCATTPTQYRVMGFAGASVIELIVVFLRRGGTSGY
jgi:hypothetical protein